ncbi:MAG: hypothetical protein II523_04725 [Bacteroidales bacterium]|nr:hypothetical protein [Bacteroidales bacterium]MBQ2499299.1 hypothetical protein [Bacteroidales bacterium]
MKRLTLLIMAIAMVMSLSQCKKKVEQVVPTGDRIVPITLDVKGGGSKINVDPNTGEVAFSQNDVVYVGSGGKYVGKLTCRGTTFKGNLTNPAMNEPLYFYFLGNREVYDGVTWDQDDLIPGSSTSIYLTVIDQTDIDNMAVISSAISDEDFTGEGTYHAFFENRGALVMFNVNTASTAPTYITGMNNEITVDFTNNSFTFSQAWDGEIELASGCGERWAILLPQNALPAGDLGSAYSDDWQFAGTRGAVPAITANGYLFEGINVNVITYYNLPTGAINGKFSINSQGNQVFFSKGNLQYQASSNTWLFAENQTDVAGNSNTNIAQNYSGLIDLFGWGTSGWNNGNNYYQPYSAGYSPDQSIAYGYGPTDGSNYNYDLSGAYANADWGVYNPILNGGNQAGIWRTLTIDEWGYILFTRETPSGINYAKANVNGRNGVILLPDNWDPSVYTLNSTNWDHAPYSDNVISSYSWAKMETNGAVFLPAAGYREGATVYNLGANGYYWSSDCYDNYYKDAFFIGQNGVGSGYYRRYIGYSVRLVQDAN